MADERDLPLPQDSLTCRQNAERSLGEWVVRDPEQGPLHAIAWALLGIGSELASIRRLLERRRR
ncbi:hypothetical protein ACFWZY_01530 [Streptomyces sp. NPDC058992]|uniref:hypothetical protein n=1 Tax=Streptomyces sp. NPDC058992 TaxID=3346688 RepID=UPI0036A69D25